MNIDDNRQLLRDRLKQLLTNDRADFRRIFDLASACGLFIYHFELEGSNISSFLYVFDSDVAAVYQNSKISEREFSHSELIDYLDSESFFLLDDFKPNQAVFDGEEYLIVYKSRQGARKILHLTDPGYSSSLELQKLISLIESEIFRKPS